MSDNYDSMVSYYREIALNGFADEEIIVNDELVSLFYVEQDDRGLFPLIDEDFAIALYPGMTIDGVGSGFWSIDILTEADCDDLLILSEVQAEEWQEAEDGLTEDEFGF